MSACVEYADCVNSVGSYMCNCNPGFTGDGFELCSGKLVIGL